MQTLRYIHRFTTVIVVLVLFYLGVTGTIIQMVDLRSILTKAPATDANVQAMREAFDGPGNYVVRKVADYDAPALPSEFDYTSALPKLIAAARNAVGAKPLSYLEFRMAGGMPVGQAGVDRGYIRFDSASGQVIEQMAVEPRDNQSPESTRNTVKRLHRMTTFGDWALSINLIVAIGLSVLIVTGVILYWLLYQGRRTNKRPAFFWSGGGTWRMLHRLVSIVAAAWLVVVTLSGAWLAFESAGLAINMAMSRSANGGGPGGAAGGRRDPPPVPPGNDLQVANDTQLPAMLATTLRAAAAEAPGDPIKVVRLRNYATYQQGIVVTGGDKSKQLVFNASTGEEMSETEPGYPKVPFPFGWQAHQTAKSIHRGDWFGLTGRWMDLLAGLSLVYLSLSGIIMYVEMWKRRKSVGRKGLFWK